MLEKYEKYNENIFATSCTDYLILPSLINNKINKIVSSYSIFYDFFSVSFQFSRSKTI